MNLFSVEQHAIADDDARYSSEQPWLDLKTAVRRFADSYPDTLRVDLARCFCVAAVRSYMAHLDEGLSQPLRSPPEVFSDLTTEGVVLADQLGKRIAAMGTDDGAYAIGTTYAMMLPPRHRASYGIYYTPPALVNYLLDRVESQGIDWATVRVLDPACGGGAFLGPVVRRMAPRLLDATPKLALRSLRVRLKGFEIDPFAAWLSEVFLDVTMREALGFSDPDFTPITVADTLGVEPEAEYGLVIGNPPYGKVRLNPATRERFTRSLFGHANLYSLFFDQALRWLSPGGTVAYVTPTSFLSGEYFKKLRGLLSKECPPREIHFVSERSGVFDDVLQETVLAVFKKPVTELRKVRVGLIRLKDGQVGVDSTTEAVLPGASSPWILPRHYDSTRFIKKVSAAPLRLADWGYKVSTGPLVWNRHKDRLTHCYVPGKTAPLIWAESVTPTGDFCFRARRRNHAPYYEFSSSADPALVRSACVLLQRTTSKEQSRRLIAAELPHAFLMRHEGAVAVENHLNMLIPIVDEPLVTTEELAAFLNSSAADAVFRCISGSVAVSAYELEAMPVPDPDRISRYLTSPELLYG